MTHWTREVIRHKISAWEAGKLTSQQIWEWAQSEWLPLQDSYDDTEQTETDVYESVCRDVLWMLEDLNINRLSSKDVPDILLYLDTQLGKYHDGKNRLDNYFNNK